MNRTDKNAQLCWDCEECELDEFYSISKSLGFNKIIYLTDFEGEIFDIWATSSGNLLNSIMLFSNMQFFVRIQNIENAILYGFDDNFLNN
jgi:hypothetical protein